MKRGIISLSLILGILLIGISSAATTCCEKTTAGAWCQNVNDATLCSTSTNPITGQAYRAVSSFCESTSYCRLGTCINQQEGTCVSSPEVVCESNDGFWSEKEQTSLPQCTLGCCLVGDQAAFVTQVSCNRMASLYGLEVNYRADIGSEIECLSSANPGVEGACVYTQNGVTNCERTTREECQSRQKSAQGDYSFHEGFLCSAQQLETICAKSQNTICKNDDVYFVDTCGNLANIYDSNRVEEENYWTLIQEPTCTASSNPGNKNSAACGDCDYYYGSMCTDKGTKSVNYGNYVCKSLDCEDYTGTYSYKSGSNPFPKHGDTWCSTDNRNGGKVDSPGSSYFRLICYNGDVTVEECGNGESGGTREMICAENKSTRTGNCKANVWQDCYNQKTRGDCTNIDVRDCKWVQVSRDAETRTGFLGATSSVSFSNYGFSNQGLTDNSSISNADGACVPNYSPGFERDGNNAVIGGESCVLASSACMVTYQQSNLESTFGAKNWKCTENCECIDSSKLGGKLNQICSSMGDCGVENNYIGKSGVNTFTNLYSVTKCLDGGNKNRCK